MANGDGYTYMVSGPVVIDGEKVPLGTIVDEAKGWKYRDQLVNHGKLTRVTEDAAKDMTRHERQDAPEEPEEEPASEETPSDDELSQEQYNALTIDEIDALLEEGHISIEEVDEFEQNTGKTYRKGVEKLVYEEDESEDEDDEG